MQLRIILDNLRPCLGVSLKFKDGCSEILRDVVSNYNLDADGAGRFNVAVSVAGMLPPVITVKMEPETKFASIKFSSSYFYEVAF